MPLPQWLARFNRRFLNPGAVKRGTWPVLVHTGRKSARTYRTPVGPEEIEDGYLFFVNYGPDSDWVKNILAAGSAQLEIDGRTIELTDPEVIPVDDAYRLLGEDFNKPPGWVGLQECLIAKVTE